MLQRFSPFRLNIPTLAAELVEKVFFLRWGTARAARGAEVAVEGISGGGRDGIVGFFRVVIVEDFLLGLFLSGLGGFDFGLDGTVSEAGALRRRRNRR